MAFPTKTSEQISYEEQLEDKVLAIDTDIANLRSSYDLRKISASDFIAKNDNLQLQKRRLEKDNETKLHSFVDDRRVFGWKTPRKFLIAFGVRLPYLVLAILISVLIGRINNRDKWANKAFFAMQIGVYASAFYQMVWVFWDSQDYPLSAYITFAFLACLISAAVVVYLFKYLKFLTIHDIKGKIRFIMSLMIDRALEDGHVKDEDKYEEEIIYPALKKLDE